MFSFLYHCHRTCLFIWVTQWVSYKKVELLTPLRGYLSSPRFFGGVRVVHLFILFVLWCPLRFPFKNSDVRFVLPAVVCRRAHVLFTLFVFVCVLMSTTYCVVFLFCFSSSCVPYVASFSGLPIFDCPFSILQHLCIAHTNVTWWYCVHLNEKNRIFYKFRKEIFK